MEKYDTIRQTTDDNTIRRMRFACQLNKANTRNVLTLTASPRQQWLRKGAFMLHPTRTACLVTTLRSIRQRYDVNEYNQI